MTYFGNYICLCVFMCLNSDSARTDPFMVSQPSPPAFSPLLPRERFAKNPNGCPHQELSADRHLLWLAGHIMLKGTNMNQRSAAQRWTVFSPCLYLHFSPDWNWFPAASFFTQISLFAHKACELIQRFFIHESRLISRNPCTVVNE